MASKETKTKKKDDGSRKWYEESENVLSFTDGMLYEAKVRGGLSPPTSDATQVSLILMHDGRY